MNRMKEKKSLRPQRSPTLLSPFSTPRLPNLKPQPMLTGKMKQRDETEACTDVSHLVLQICLLQVQDDQIEHSRLSWISHCSCPNKWKRQDQLHHLWRNDERSEKFKSTHHRFTWILWCLDLDVQALPDVPFQLLHVYLLCLLCIIYILQYDHSQASHKGSHQVWLITPCCHLCHWIQGCHHYQSDCKRTIYWTISVRHHCLQVQTK